MMQVSDMALEVVWVLAALIILATLCIREFKGILSNSVLRQGPRDFLLDRLARFFSIHLSLLFGTMRPVSFSPWWLCL